MARFRAALTLLAIAFAGCGGGGDDATRDAGDINRDNHAHEVVAMQRVLGDDPVSESVSLRADGTAAVRRGGGRGYWDVAVALSPADSERMLALVRRAPFAALADNTITPGGFSGDDDGIRYMLRRNGQSVTVAGTQLPPAMRRLVVELDALIDGDRGRIVADDRHYSASGVTGSGKGGDDAVTDVKNSPVTPVAFGDGPEAAVSLSCYGSAGRWGGGTPAGAGAGRLVFVHLGRRERGHVIHAPVVVQPGASVTVAVAGGKLLYGPAWRKRRLSGAAPVVRFEGCSDTTAGGGPARFDGALVAPRRGCATLSFWLAGRDEPVRRRVACRGA